MKITKRQLIKLIKEQQKTPDQEQKQMENSVKKTIKELILTSNKALKEIKITNDYNDLLLFINRLEAFYNKLFTYYKGITGQYKN